MIVTTIHGCRFDEAEPVWRIRTPTSKLLFDFLIPDAEESFCITLRASAARLLKTHRPELVHEALKRCRVLLRHARKRRGKPVDLLSRADFETYRDSLPDRSRQRADLTLDRLKKLASNGFRGLDADFRLALPILRVTVVAAASPANLACPRGGALSSAELRCVVVALDDAFAAGRVTLANFALCVIVLGLAPRPGQASILKTSDLKIIHLPNGTIEYWLTMPLIKCRQESLSPLRAPPRRLHPCIGAVLARQRDEATEWGASRGIAANNCPMFPEHSEKTRGIAWPDLPFTNGHATAANISARVIATFRKLDLSSMRANDDERKVYSTRIRRTLATIAHGNGCSYGQVGDLLWQSGDTAAHFYCGPSVGVIESVEEAIDFQPLADACRRELEAVGIYIGASV